MTLTDGQTYHAPAWGTISGACGSYPLRISTLKNAIGLGWDWSATLGGNLANFDPYFAREGEIELTLSDGLGNEVTSPPLVAVRRHVTDDLSGIRVELGGICKASHMLRAGGHSFPSFRWQLTDDLIEALAARAGLTINGFPSWWVSEEDVKQASLAAAFQRWLEAAGYEFSVELDGSILCRDPFVTSGTLTMPSSSREVLVNYSDPIDRLTIGKRTGLSSEAVQGFAEAGPAGFALPNPLNNCISIDESASGSIKFIAYWNGDPEQGGGLIQVDGTVEGVVLPDPTATWPATHITLLVVAPQQGGAVSAQIRIQGVIDGIPSGLENEFLFTHGSGHFGEPARIDSLLPNRTYAEGRAPALLWIRNKGQDTKPLSGPLWCAAAVWQAWGGYRVDQVSHELAEGSARTSVVCVKLPA